MEKIKIIFISNFIMLLCAIPLFLLAQKLPKIQQGSVRAPDNIKIDGKTTEWNDQFRAYNANCRIYYTISNDDQHLYLTVQAKGKYVNAKILSGGISFTISTLATKGERSANVAITFPAVPNKRSIPGEILENHAAHYYNGLNTDTTVNKKEIDSLIFLTNTEFAKLYNEVQVTGIKEITEPVISIYNTDGIKVAAKFDSRMKYNYELAIPLKYLGFSVNNENKFKYNIKLNAIPTVMAPGGAETPTPGNLSYSSQDVLYERYATDFSGEYMLATKP